MKKIVITAVSALAFAVASQSVLAKKMNPAESKMVALKTAEFNTANTDTNDDLTLTELSTYIANKTADRFAALDIDTSDTIDLAEFTVKTTFKTIGLATELFTLADADGNESLNLDEFTTTTHGNSRAEIIHYFAGLDKNLDLVISLQEYINRPKKSEPTKIPKKPGHK